MRIHSAFLYMIILCGIQLNAQDSEAAKKLLNQVSNKIKSFETMKFDFDYVLENRQENIKQETNGSVIVSGERYKLSFLGVEQYRSI